MSNIDISRTDFGENNSNKEKENKKNEENIQSISKILFTKN